MGIIKDTLNELNTRLKVRGAMPGHKGKITVEASHDITELPEADNLQKPTGMIREAETEAARIYGTAHARYLVNGSSCGNLTMIFSFFEEGDEILVERGCHKSVFNGIILRKLRPVYLWPEHDGTPQSPQAVREALQDHPQAKGLLLTLPAYNGWISDYEAIWDAAREAGVRLLIDGAHGAALAGVGGFASFYRSCDAMVVSVHKSLACLNQGALLLNNRPEFQPRILKYSNMFQTTSPSYLIMESMEAALEDLETGLYEQPPDFSQEAYQNLSLNPTPRKLRSDPWKLLIQAKGRGDEMENFLEQRGIYPEMHDEDSVLLMLSPYNREGEIRLIRDVLQALDRHLGELTANLDGQAMENPWRMPRPAQRLMPWQAGDEYEEVCLDDTPGRIIQEQVVPYPPGVPVLVPGEVIDTVMVDHIKALIRNHIEIIGLHGDRLRCLKEEQ